MDDPRENPVPDASRQAAERLSDFLEEGMASGSRPLTDEVWADIERRMKARYEARLEQLRRDIQEGLDSGPSVPLDIERIKAEGRRLLRESKSKKK